MSHRTLRNGGRNAARQPRAFPTAQGYQPQMVDGAPTKRRRLVQHETDLSSELLHCNGASTSEPRGPVPVIDLTRDEDEEQRRQQFSEPELTELSYEEWLAMRSERNITPITGLRLEQISKMRRYRRFHVPYGNQDEEICGICLEASHNGNDFVSELDFCSHEFHFPCISNWLKQKNSCPMCKQTALSIPLKDR